MFSMSAKSVLTLVVTGALALSILVAANPEARQKAREAWIRVGVAIEVTLDRLNLWGDDSGGGLDIGLDSGAEAGFVYDGSL